MIAAMVQVLDHPLAAAQLAILRAKATPPNDFRSALHKLALLLLMEAARSWKSQSAEMQSPLQAFTPGLGDAGDRYFGTG